MQFPHDPRVPLSDDTCLMTLQQLAAYLQVTGPTVTALFKAGKIPCIRIGKLVRFHRTTVIAALTLKPVVDPDDPCFPVGRIVHHRRLGPRVKKNEGALTP